MKDSLVFYISQYEAVKKLDNQQLGALYRAIFETAKGNKPEIPEDIEIAYNFMQNQVRVDSAKYEETSRKRSEAGKLGGAPKGNKNACKTSKTSKNKQNKLNDNDNDNDNDNVNVNEGGTAQETHTLRPGQILYGELQNVAMTSEERKKLDDTYQDSKKLVNKVSRWLPNAEKDFPDHYALCLTFAGNDNWPKKKKAEPVEEKPIEAEPMPEDMRASIYGRLGKAFD